MIKWIIVVYQRFKNTKSSGHILLTYNIATERGRDIKTTTSVLLRLSKVSIYGVSGTSLNIYDYSNRDACFGKVASLCLNSQTY